MRRRAGALLGTVVAVALLAAAVAAPGAQGAFGIASWEAGTCRVDATPIAPCTYESPPSSFDTQVAGRPSFGITDFTLNTNILGFPEGQLRDVRVDLPVGLSVNPQATSAQCTESQLEASDCPAASKVGTVYVTAIEPFGSGVPIPATVYNIVPRNGIPAQFGFHIDLLGIVKALVYLEATVSWESDYHQGFTIRMVPNQVPLAGNRLVFEGRAGNGSFITLGSDCNGSTTTGLTVDSYQQPGNFLSYDTTPILPKEIIAPTGCEQVPFEPGMTVDPGTTVTDSSTGGTVDVTVPFEPGEEIGQANVKRAQVTLPLGGGLNPSAARGLEACTDAQFGKGIAIGDRISDPGAVHPPPTGCPPASRIGSVAIETPVLPAGSLSGDVYLGDQLSRDPASGKLYRIFVDAQSPRFGVYVRLLGEVAANPANGQLTARFDDPQHGGLPQVPFSSFKVSFDGARGVLTSPPTCGPNVASSLQTPWTGNSPVALSSSFVLTHAPGGAPCAPSMAARPFSPGFAAAPSGNRAKAFEPLAVHLTRPPGQQELKGVDITLPPGATARLKGVPYCPPGAIAAAAQRPGVDERANPSCPVASRVGVASILAGTGPAPLRIDGTAYLAGPTRGAPLSLAVITPALAGPFDLGVVVVRVPLFVHPETARITALAEIPDVFGGAKLSIRSVFLTVNRPDFALNGTNCRPGAVAGVLRGGGADPAVPASFSSAPVSAPYRSGGCRKLRFKPKLNLRLFGATQRNRNPKLRAVLRARSKDANIRRAVVALPHALFLDQASLATICTRVQFAAGNCPRRSIYGRARAFTPLLDEPLEGPVYLRSSDNPLPDLVAHLEGQVDIDLVGRIDSFRGGIRTTFGRVPDVPVSRFVMNLRGGKRGLLVASRNLCRQPVRGIVGIKGQNGRKANKKAKLRTPCDGKGSRGKRGGSKSR